MLAERNIMKKITAHEQHRFLNCLRIQVVPGYHEQERIESIVNFCKAYSFDNVMLFINAEEYNPPVSIKILSLLNRIIMIQNLSIG